MNPDAILGIRKEVMAILCIMRGFKALFPSPGGSSLAKSGRNALGLWGHIVLMGWSRGFFVAHPMYSVPVDSIWTYCCNR